MKCKYVLVGGALVTIAYNAGKLVAYYKSIKFVLDCADEISPGTKKNFVKGISDAVIDDMFKSKSDSEKE